MLNRITASTLLGTLTLSLSQAATQEPAVDLAHTVKTVYAFAPHSLSKDEITAKSKELDRFWETVKAEPSRFLAPLRTALVDPTNPAFFYFDGSMLLLSLSAERDDQELALSAIPRCDLRDIQPDSYLINVAKLARVGLNTSEAAFKILDNSDFKVFVPQHSLTVGQDFALILMLLPTSEDFYVSKAVDRLRKEDDPEAQRSLLRLLWYTVTDAGDRIISTVAADQSRKPDVRTFAQDLAVTTATLEKESKPSRKLLQAVADFVPKGSTFGEVKIIRRNRLSRITDEALYELDDLTRLLRILKKKDRP